MNIPCNQACPYNTLKGCTIPEHPGAVCPLRNGNGTYSVWQSDESDYVRGYKDGFNAAKAIEAEPVKHGRWDGPFKVDADHVGFKCSICAEYVVPCWNYCPNCGCKMDLED